jgi:mono/diheme cytochrome c family protein
MTPNVVRSLLICSLAVAAGAAHGGEAPAAPPDARRGEALYVGSTRFAAGGAPCLACHGIAGHGLARAASFGPDLSGAHASFGADGLASVLEDVVFPTMQPIYRTHAVTPQERADLVAFLGEAQGGAQAPRLGAGFRAGVVVAMGLFLAFVLAVGRRGGARRAPPAPRSGGRP